MTASELRELAEHISEEYWSGNAKKFAAAAEVLELVAWAEESEVHVERYGGMWFVYFDGVEYGGDTLIDTLRRAREVAR